MDRSELKNRKAFATQKCHATKVRGVGFLLTYDEWCDIWEQSGHFEERGPHTGQYCMCRYGDVGPYAVGNVFIQLSTKNLEDRRVKPRPIKRTKEEADKLRGRKGRPAWNKGIPNTPEQKQKQSIALKGRPGWSKGLPAHNIGISPPKYECVKCKGLFSKANITRWHNDGCRKGVANGI